MVAGQSGRLAPHIHEQRALVRLALQPHDVGHASQHELETASKTDREHPRQASLQSPEFRYQSRSGLLEPLSIPCPQLPGPIQDLLLKRDRAAGDRALGATPALVGSCGEDGYVKSSLLPENVLHSVQQGGFRGIAVSGVVFQIGVDFNRELIEVLAGRLIPIGFLLRHELLNGWKAISPRASVCAPPAHA